MVANGRMKDADKIGVGVGKVINKYKMAKHVELDIQDGHFCSQYLPVPRRQYHGENVRGRPPTA